MTLQLYLKLFDISSEVEVDEKLPKISLLSLFICRGTIGGKTGKTAVLPGFCKIERAMVF